jgi:hypothetical protein
MEPLFSAVICGCNAGLFREALHEVYIPRIQRGNAYFAANNLGARGALLSALVQFFQEGRWGSFVEVGVEGQSLTAEDQLFILMQAGLYLTATRGLGARLQFKLCQEPVSTQYNTAIAMFLVKNSLRIADRRETAANIVKSHSRDTNRL